MTATTAAPAADTRHVTVVSHKAPIALAAITVLFGILIALAPRVGLTHFRFATDGDLIALPGAALPGTTTAWVCIGIAAALSLGAAVADQGRAHGADLAHGAVRRRPAVRVPRLVGRRQPGRTSRSPG